ncbi:MAG: ABC transporter ATP-binding protein [Prolixibacteraceae bacterium]|nr:ABC transporter ATP-binding protein [Prolixibacteraceae bacterium]
MIRFNNVSKSYGDVQAVSDISFEVKEHELFGLIGPDGAGKTTLLRMLVSLLLPDFGSISLAGCNVVGNYRKVRSLVGYMPGRFSLYQDLSVEENLSFFASVFGSSIAENYHLIEPIYKQIEPFRKRRAGKLSGGMKQKLALSCALIHKPVVLVLDEPTTGVDAVSRHEFWDMLDNLKKAGITIIVSTPYMDEASRCDRVALIQQGCILSIDTPGSIVQTHGKQHWNIKARERYKLITDLEAWEQTASVYPFGQYLHLKLKSGGAGRNEIIAYLKRNNHEQIEACEGTPGIEDVFIDLMTENDKKQIEA